MLHYVQPKKPVFIDLRDTLEPFDLAQDPWAREWAWLARIDQRGFARFEIVDADMRFALGRTTLVVTIMDSFSCWFEVGFVLESLARTEREAGIEGFGCLCRAVGLTEIEDSEELVGRKGAFRVASADGDVDFMPLDALDA